MREHFAAQRNRGYHHGLMFCYKVKVNVMLGIRWVCGHRRAMTHGSASLSGRPEEDARTHPECECAKYISKLRLRLSLSRPLSLQSVQKKKKNRCRCNVFAVLCLWLASQSIASKASVSSPGSAMLMNKKRYMMTAPTQTSCWLLPACFITALRFLRKPFLPRGCLQRL